MSKKRAVLYVLTAGSMWGLLGVTVRLLSEFGFSSTQIVVGRFFMAAVVLCIYLCITDREKLRIHKGDLRYFVILGFFCILFYNVCYTITVQLTSLSIAVALLYTSPVWAMLFSIPMFHEKLTKRKCFSALISFAGCALMSGVFSAGGLNIQPIGIVTGILAGIGYGSYGIFAKVLTGKYHSLTITFYTFFLASIGGLFICSPVEMLHIVGESPDAILYFLGAAIVCFVVPYVIYNLALREIEASRAAVIAAIEPVMATVFGALFYGEWPSMAIACGMGMVICAIILLNTRKEKSEK